MMRTINEEIDAYNKTFSSLFSARAERLALSGALSQCLYCGSVKDLFN